MKKLTILIDMDDVLNNAVEAWVNYLNEKYRTNVKPDEVVSWDIHEAFPSLTKEEVYSIELTDDFWKNVEPRTENINAVKKIIDDGHKVFIVTASIYQKIETKMDRFFEFCPFLTWDDIIVTSQKQFVRGDVLIDDGIHNLEHGDYCKILINRPHNHFYDAEANGMLRVNTVEEAYTAIGKLYKL